MDHALIVAPPIGFKGHFTVELISAKSGLILRRLEFDNLITDVGLANITSNSAGWATSYMAVGAGSTPPAVTDTQLEAQLAADIGSGLTARSNTVGGGAADTSGYVAGPPDYCWYKRTRTFYETQGNGTITEIGLFNTGSVGVMFARQLLKDADGNPTSIVKTNLQQLRITYELRVYPPQTDVTGTFTLRGVTYNYTVRARGVMADWLDAIYGFTGGAGMTLIEDNSLLARTSTTGGTTGPNSSVVNHVAGNNYADTTGVWEPTAANFATGIGGSHFTWLHYSQGPYSYWDSIGMRAVWTPKIIKTNLQRLTVTVRSSWGRYP